MTTDISMTEQLREMERTLRGTTGELTRLRLRHDADLREVARLQVELANARGILRTKGLPMIFVPDAPEPLPAGDDKCPVCGLMDCECGSGAGP